MNKVMLLFPICKFLETLINGVFLGSCPWVSNYGETNNIRYVDMARITIITVTYTLIMAMIYLMCKGWNTITF